MGIRLWMIESDVKKEWVSKSQARNPLRIEKVKLKPINAKWRERK